MLRIMKIMKRFAAFLLVMAIAVPSIKADKLYIHFTTGEQMELDFVDKPTISFNSRNALKIKSETMSMKVKAFNTVTKITFDSQSGVSDVMASDKLISPDRGNQVAFLGFKVGTQITVTAINGTVCRSASIDDESRYELSLDGLPKGVYVITADKEVCKLVVE